MPFKHILLSCVPFSESSFCLFFPCSQPISYLKDIEWSSFKCCPYLAHFICVSVSGIMVSIAAFQAVDPGLIPGWRNFKRLGPTSKQDCSKGSSMWSQFHLMALWEQLARGSRGGHGNTWMCLKVPWLKRSLKRNLHRRIFWCSSLLLSSALAHKGCHTGGFLLAQLGHTSFSGFQSSSFFVWQQCKLALQQNGLCRAHNSHLRIIIHV